MNKLYSISLIWSCFLIAQLPVSEQRKIDYVDAIVPTNIDLRKRVITGVCCSDSQYLPKVEHAGKVFTHADGSSYQLMHNGLKVIADCYYGSWMTTLIELLHGHHEPQEEAPFHEVLKFMPQDAVMIEMGSYWSFYSMWFQQEISNAHNFLIEPDPKNLEIGKKNFAMNAMHGVFTQGMIGATSLENQRFVDWDYNEHFVNMVAIDDFASEHDIDFIHLLHSDIQGAEVDMLKGCKKLIQEKRIGFFFVSTHRGVHEICLDILEKSGYEILLSITRAESFTADGLIIAKLPGLPGPTSLQVSRRTPDFCAYIDALD